MRIRIALVVLVLLAAVPADAGWGGLLKAAGKASSAAGKASHVAPPPRAISGASRAAGGMHTPTAVPALPRSAPHLPRAAPKASPRAAVHMAPEARRMAAMALLVHADDASPLRAFRRAAGAEESSALEKILETSVDAADSLLDIVDLQDGFQPEEREPLVDAEWGRHAKRLKRIEQLRAAAQAKGDSALVAQADRLRDKETRRHERVLALADRGLQ